MTTTTQEQNNFVKKHNLFLLNNTRIEYNSNTGYVYIWVYHDKNYKNGTFYQITDKGVLSLCTIRENSFDEEIISW